MVKITIKRTENVHIGLWGKSGILLDVPPRKRWPDIPKNWRNIKPKPYSTNDEFLVRLDRAPEYDPLLTEIWLEANWFKKD